MRSFVKLAIVLGVLVALGSTLVHGACGTPGSTFTCNYFDAPIGQDVASAWGTFWGLGQFNPASPGGTDNGGWPVQAWLRYTPGGGFYLAGDWSTLPLIDGCIQDPPNPQPANMAAAWTTSNASTSYFVAVCTTEGPIGSFDPGLLEIPGVPMTVVPTARIVGSARIPPNRLQLSVSHDALGGGVYNSRQCTLAVTGFKIYYAQVPAFTPAPATRDPDVGWTLFGSASEGGVVQNEIICDTTHQTDVYLMLTLVLDGNVELERGGPSPIRVECRRILADPQSEGDPPYYLIHKPKSTKGR